jgi:tripartite-type tricarboxylate transporter receptor subunit TctC
MTKGRTLYPTWPSIRAAALAVAAVVGLAPATVVAQEYPSKPIEMIVGFAPGGGTDLVARALARGMSSQLGTPVQVVNRPGGSGVVGFELLANARNDGYTMGIITAQLITANLRGARKISYGDLTNVAMISVDQSAIAVPTASPFQSLNDLLTAAREKPGQLTVANASEGGSYHMMARNLETAAEVKFKHIPFDGGPAAILQLIGNHVQSAAIGATEILPHVQAGKARVLAVAGAEGEPRFKGLPEVQTTAELGFPVSISTWRALSMPKDVDPVIVAKVSAAIEATLKDADFLQQMETINSTVRYLGAKELEAFLVEQNRTYGKLFSSK